MTKPTLTADGYQIQPGDVVWLYDWSEGWYQRTVGKVEYGKFLYPESDKDGTIGARAASTFKVKPYDSPLKWYEVLITTTQPYTRWFSTWIKERAIEECKELNLPACVCEVAEAYPLYFNHMYYKEKYPCVELDDE